MGWNFKLKLSISAMVASDFYVKNILQKLRLFAL
jgi:hypothetical protein